VINTISVLVLAAGNGNRIGSNPKAFIDSSGKTLLEHAVEQLACLADEMIVGLRGEDLEIGRNILSAQDVCVMEGDTTRLNTINKLLQASTKDIVVIHDVARPFISIDVFDSIIQAAIKYGASSTYTAASIRDGVALRKGEFYSESLDKDEVILTQTPQAFQRQVLIDAFSNCLTHHWLEIGPTAIVSRSGYKIRLVQGSEKNIKITYPEDLKYINTGMKLEKGYD